MAALEDHFKVIGYQVPEQARIDATVSVTLVVKNGQVVAIEPQERWQYRLNHQSGNWYLTVEPNPNRAAAEQASDSDELTAPQS